MDFKEELELLLNHFIITKVTQPEAYYKVKAKIKKLQEFTRNKLGCDIIINSAMIKLEKVPSMIDNTYRIEAFDSRKDYIFLMLLIMFLEDKGKEEQFILSNFTTFVINTLSLFPNTLVTIDFKDYSTRKSLVDVMRYATNLGLIQLRDGNDTLFKDSIEVEALYENTGISHYMVRQFKDDIYAFQKPIDFLNTTDTEDTLNKKRYYTYRSLLYYPLFCANDLEPEVFQYLIFYRNRVMHDLEHLLDGNLILLKKMALLTTEEKIGRDIFPNSRKILADIVLLVHSYLTNGHFEEDHDGFLILDRLELEQLLETLKTENRLYFSKEYRDMPADKFFITVVEYMKRFKILKEEDDHFLFAPIVHVICGHYQKEESNPQIETTYNQIQIDFEV